jgi:hypothetical protein
VYLPEGWTERPSDVNGVLRMSRDILDEEGRWRKGDWFANEHPELDPNDPFCNNWQACAEGLIGIAAIGVVRDEGAKTLVYVFDTASVPISNGGLRLDLYYDACRALRHAIRRLEDDSDDNYLTIISANDCRSTTLADVRRWFDAAIEDTDEG